jgi:hypothetical protein
MNTAKSKAKELVDKYKEIEIGSEGFHSWGMHDYQAKQCAILCVDEILATGNFVPEGSYFISKHHKKSFWEQVKTEIGRIV